MFQGISQKRPCVPHCPFFPFTRRTQTSIPPVSQVIECDDDPESFNGPLSDLGIKTLSSVLPKLRKVNLSHNQDIKGESLFSLCKNCEFLEEVLFFECLSITKHDIASAIRERPNLKSFSVASCVNIEGPYVTSHFIDSLVSLKTLTCLALCSLEISDELLFSIANEGLPLRKLVLQWCYHFSYAGIFCLLSKCRFVQHLELAPVSFLNDQRVAELSTFLGELIFIDLSDSCTLTYSAFFALAKNCRLLNEIKMEGTDIGKHGLEDSNSLMYFVNPQVKSLYLGRNASLSDESIKILVSICPNLELLDLSCCRGISEGIVEVLRICRNIRHLNLAFCSGLKIHGMNFEMPKLEVLNLSRSGIDDEILSVISKSCCRLVHLDLRSCSEITAKGVRQAVKNCTQLREINLLYCPKVTVDVVVWMVFSRPSLRKIIAPPNFNSSYSQRERLLRHGCLVWYPKFCDYQVVEVP